MSCILSFLNSVLDICSGTLSIINANVREPSHQFSKHVMRVVRKLLTVDVKKRPSIGRVLEMVREWGVSLRLSPGELGEGVQKGAEDGADIGDVRGKLKSKIKKHRLAASSPAENLDLHFAGAVGPYASLELPAAVKNRRPSDDWAVFEAAPRPSVSPVHCVPAPSPDWADWPSEAPPLSSPALADEWGDFMAPNPKAPSTAYREPPESSPNVALQLDLLAFFTPTGTSGACSESRHNVSNSRKSAHVEDIWGSFESAR